MNIWLVMDMRIMNYASVFIKKSHFGLRSSQYMWHESHWDSEKAWENCITLKSEFEMNDLEKTRFYLGLEVEYFVASLITLRRCCDAFMWIKRSLRAHPWLSILWCYTRPIPSEGGWWRGIGARSFISKCNWRFILLGSMHQIRHFIYCESVSKI